MSLPAPSGVGVPALSDGLDFIPVQEEHYDFALVADRRGTPAVAAFLDAL